MSSQKTYMLSSIKNKFDSQKNKWQTGCAINHKIERRNATNNRLDGSRHCMIQTDYPTISNKKV